MADKQEIALLKKVYTELRLYRTAPKTWMSGRDVAKITGWNMNKLRDARNNGTVIFKYNDNGGIVYEVDSVKNIPQELHTKKAV